MARKKRKVPEWPRRDELALLTGVGVEGVAALRRSCGKRTEAAVRQKLYRMIGSTSLCRGTYSLKAACDRTGYHRTQLVRAQRALDQRWKRTRSGGRYMITDAQLEELVAWLAHDYWCPSLRLYGCARCSATARPPAARGLCRPCYDWYRRRCERDGVPATLAGQRLLVAAALRATGRRECGTILRGAARRLERGLALGEHEVAVLADLDPGWTS